MYLFLLSKENLELSKWEVLLLLEIEKYKETENLLLIPEISEKNFDRIQRLAYTKKVYKLLFQCPEKSLIKNLENYDFSKIYKKSFSLKFSELKKKNKDKEKKNSYSEAELAKYIWRKVDKPVVDLDNAGTKIELIFSRNSVFCCQLIGENEEKFQLRRSHLRPESHPTSLSPKFARCLVNLAGSEEILDPFCGCGGILIEAGLMKLRIFGCDLNPWMIARTKINLDYFKIKNYKVQIKNALDMKGKFEAIVTDVPYGKGSRVYENVEELYAKFLKKSTSLTRKMVIIFPNFIAHKNLIQKNKWKIIKSFSLYIHRSLTRKIYVLGR